MEPTEDSQDRTGNGDELGETSRPSQPRPRLDYSVPGFSYYTQTPEEYFFGLQSSTAADGAGNDQTARVDPKQEGEENVPTDRMATAKGQESTAGSCRRKSDDHVGNDRRARADSKQEGENGAGNVLVREIRMTIHPSKAERLSELPEVSSAPSDGRNVFPSTRNTDAVDQAANDQTTRKEVGQAEENTQGRDGDRRRTMVHDESPVARSDGQRRDNNILPVDSTDMSLREWPLLGSIRGMRGRRRR